MNTAPPAGSALATPAGTAGPTTPKKGPPKFKQRQTRTFKSKAPKPGQKGFGDDIPGVHSFVRGVLSNQCRPAFARKGVEARLQSSSHVTDPFLWRDTLLTREMFKYPPPFGFRDMHDKLKDVLNLLPAQPEQLKKECRRKHITMMSTVLNLNDTDMDLLADFLGHDLQMDKKYYRLPEGTLQLAKITKVLMAMEQGRLNEFKGKGLDQIHISPVECVELDEESDTDLTEETPGRSCEPQERTREAMAGRSGSKKRKWSEEDKGTVEETYIQFMDSGATPGNADSCMHQGSATSPQRAGLAGSEVLCQEQNYSTCEQDYQ